MHKTIVIACVLAAVVSEPIGAQGTEACGEVRVWRFPAAIGLTDFDHDVDAPGRMTSLGVERRLGGRLSVGVELGLGSTDRAGQCSFGSVQSACDVTEHWGSYGAGAALRLFRLGEASTGLLGQIGWAGPDTAPFYDVGLSFSYETAGSLNVGVELRRRSGDNAGLLYLFRVARRWSTDLDD